MENHMYSSKQAISAMLRSMGPQSLDTLMLECRIHATDEPDLQSVKKALAEMIESGEVFTDDDEYSLNAEDFEPSKLIHFSQFIVKAFD
jgi:hypothetical protein